MSGLPDVMPSNRQRWPYRCQLLCRASAGPRACRLPHKPTGIHSCPETGTKIQSQWTTWWGTRAGASPSILTRIFRLFLFGSTGSLLVSLSCHLLSCSDRLNRAEADLFSKELMAKHLSSTHKFLSFSRPSSHTGLKVDRLQSLPIGPTFQNKSLSDFLTSWGSFAPSLHDCPLKLNRETVCQTK